MNVYIYAQVSYDFQDSVASRETSKDRPPLLLLKLNRSLEAANLRRFNSGHSMSIQRIFGGFLTHHLGF